MAPEYFGGEQLSVNADVYSFGIVLLELVTGKKISSEKGMLLGWVRYSEIILIVFRSEDIFLI